MGAAGPIDEYSEIADQQLDILERALDSRSYNAVLKICGEILDTPHEIRKFSSVLTTNEGLRFAMPVSGEYPYKIFWSMSQAGICRIEAVFPFPH